MRPGLRLAACLPAAGAPCWPIEIVLARRAEAEGVGGPQPGGVAVLIAGLARAMPFSGPARAAVDTALLAHEDADVTWGDIFAVALVAVAVEPDLAIAHAEPTLFSECLWRSMREVPVDPEAEAIDGVRHPRAGPGAGVHKS